MAERYTRKDVDSALGRLAAALGKPVGHYRTLAPGEESNMYPSSTYSTVPGGWALDHNPTYGGYVIHEIADVPGETWIREPFGTERRSAREMVSVIRFALDTLAASRKV